MKKLFIYIFFFIFCAISWANTPISYQNFYNGKKYFKNKEYSKSVEYFEQLIRLYPNSSILNSNLPYYYLGMSYYYLEDFEKASFYLEKAIPVRDNYTFYNDANDDITYFAKRDYFLGVSLLKINQIEKGIVYLKRVNYKTFNIFSSYFEKEALKILKDYDTEQKYLLDIKFNFDFSNLSHYSIDDLIGFGNYFDSSKRYNISEKFYYTVLNDKNILLSPKIKSTIYDRYLYSLLAQDKFDKILELTQPLDYKELDKFYRGVVFYYQKQYSKSLFLLENLEENNLKKRASYYIASIYFAFEDYNNTIKFIENNSKKNIIEDSITTYSYFALNNKKVFNKYVNIMKNKYKNSFNYLYFLFLQNSKASYLNSNNFMELLDFIEYIIKNSKELNEDFRNLNYKEVDYLKNISKLQDINLLNVSFINSSLLSSEDIIKQYHITNILEQGEFYNLALNNSLKHLDDFLEYKELIYKIFPRYYHQKIKKLSIQYDVPEELIFTIIYVNSQFDTNYIGEDNKYGIMALPFSNFEEFTKNYSLDNNLKEGVILLKKYFELYNRDAFKTLIGYVYGEKFVKEITINDTLNLNAIFLPKDKIFLQNLFMTYFFYKKLYYF